MLKNKAQIARESNVTLDIPGPLKEHCTQKKI